jgi:hypothetical protein
MKTKKKKIKRFDYFLKAKDIEDKDTLRIWNSCAFEAIENKLNEIIDRLNKQNEKENP